MTYDASRHAATPRDPRPAPALALARWQFARLLETVLWFVGIVVTTLPLLIWWAIDRYGDQIGVSIWEQFSTQGPAWFLFAAGIKATTTYLPVQVAMGATRGRHVTASALTMFAGAVLLSAFAAAGLLLEAAAYRGYGLEQPLTVAHLYARANEVGLVFVEYSLRYLGFASSGMLAGLAYYRFGGLIGTGLLVVTLLPLGLIVTAMSPTADGLASVLGGMVGAPDQVAGPTGPATAARLGLALALAIATLVAVRGIASSIPLRTKVD